MQDNDFDKIFGHKFNQLPGSSYREEDWSELSKRLDRKRGQRWVLPFFLPLFGLLAGGNIFWWHQWKEASRPTAASEMRATAVSGDTIIRKTVVYLYDTVYYRQTTIVQQEITRAGSADGAADNHIVTQIPKKEILPSIATADNTAKNDKLETPIPAGPIAPDTITVQQADIKKQSPDHTIVQKVAPDSSLLQTVPETAANLPVSDTIFEDLLKKSPLPTKKSHKPLIYLARPRIGVNATWAKPHIDHQLSGNVLGAGLRSDVEIARQFRLGAEIAYLQASMKASETEALEDIDIDIPHPGGDFQLKYWETYFLPVFSYALNLRYEIPVRGKWKPWVSTGVQACSSLPFEVEFEFENNVNSLELHVPARTQASTRIQGMTLAAGVECPLNEHFRFGLEANILRRFGEDPGLLDRQTGLKTAIWYAF